MDEQVAMMGKCLSRNVNAQLREEKPRVHPISQERTLRVVRWSTFLCRQLSELKAMENKLGIRAQRVFGNKKQVGLIADPLLHFSQQ